MQSKAVRRSLWISYSLLALGFVFLGWLVYRLGPSTIASYLKLLGFNWFWLFLPSLLFFIVSTRAWNTFLKGNGIPIPFFHLMMSKIAGEGVNSINPLSWGAGDPVRIYLIKNWVPVSQGTASVVVDRTLNSMSEVLFMVIGVFIAFHYFDLTPTLQIGFYGSLLFIIWMTYYWYRRQHEGVFAFLVETLTRLKIKRHWSKETMEKVGEIDRLITEYYLQNKMGFFISFCLHFTGRLLGVFEIYLISYFLGGPLDAVSSYLLISVTAIINLIFVFVPGTVGVLEGAYAGIFHLLHQDPALGTSIQILRRIRITAWCALGFFYIYYLDRKMRLKKKEATDSRSLGPMEIPTPSSETV